MEGSWYVVLRDIVVILAGASVVTTSVFAGLVVWQLYRLFKEFRAEAQPILDSVRETADTVQGTTTFVSQHAVPPAATAAGLTAGAVSVYRQLDQFYRGLRRDDTASISEG